jgi:hypothetical protein
MTDYCNRVSLVLSRNAVPIVDKNDEREAVVASVTKAIQVSGENEDESLPVILKLMERDLNTEVSPGMCLFAVNPLL